MLKSQPMQGGCPESTPDTPLPHLAYLLSQLSDMEQHLQMWLWVGNAALPHDRLEPLCTLAAGVHPGHQVYLPHSPMSYA